MLDFEEALDKVLRRAKRLPTVKIPIGDSLGHVLAKEVKTREPIPRFDSSSVDGYAVRLRDLAKASKDNPVRLEFQGIRLAGKARHDAVKRGHTIKIMTGALLPKEADAVVMKEYVSVVGKKIVFTSPGKDGENLRRRGEEFKRREIVFPRGTLITPPVVGMLATLGIKAIPVYRRPRVAIIVTGSELRSLGAVLQRGQIHDSNSYALSATLHGLRLPPVLTLHVRDAEKEIAKAFAHALRVADVVISAGGVSVGDFDFVKQVLGDLRVETVFWRIAMKPGKPNYFGARGTRLVFGLPGNPVSALISFELLVIPALLKMMGRHVSETTNERAIIDCDLQKSAGRVEFVRGVATRMPDGQLMVKPSRGQGSHMVGGLAQANSLIIFPRESERIEKGEIVTIRRLSWNR